MRKFIRIALLSAILCSLPIIKTSAQSLPYLDYYLLIEVGSGNPPGDLFVSDGEGQLRWLAYASNVGTGNIGYRADVRTPVERLLYQSGDASLRDIYMSATDPATAGGLIYPTTYDGLFSTYIHEDIPATVCNIYNDVGGLMYTFRARFMAPMVTPSPLTSSAFGRTICAADRIVLSTSGNTVPYSDKYVKTSVEWQYRLNGGTWKALTITEGADYNDFTPALLIPELKTAKQSVQLQYRFKAEYAHATYYSPYSAASGTVEILPAPPTLSSLNAIIKTPSCKDKETGVINIAGSAINSGFTEMRWLLRRGNVTAPCDPDNPNSPCGNLDKWSDGNVPVSGGISVDSLAADTYSLWIINKGDDNIGSCYTPYVFAVPGMDPLSVAENTAQHKDISCYDGSDGVISITAAGADVNAGYTFTLLLDGVPIITDRPGTGRNILFDQLRTGTYRVQVKNSSCNTEVATTGNILIKQPPRVNGELVSFSPKCVSPGDGSIDIQAKATGGTVTNYVFNLYRNGGTGPYRQSGAVTTDHYTFNDLPGGNYRAEILNNDVNCPGWDTTVTLSTLVPLTLNIGPVDSISCYGAQEGKLICTASGGSGTYDYTLLQNNTPVTSNTTGTFTGLSAGNYTVTVKNQGNTCNDQVTRNISIAQRNALQLSLIQTPISCYGEDDAIIASVVNGGSGNYNYHWQELKNGAWTDNTIWLGTDTKIEALPAGTYHLIITDNKAPGCSITSAANTVAVATEVRIAGITVHDAICLADGAHIDMTGTGGTGTYQYEWSVNGGSYQPFTATTDIHAAGTYKLRLSDGHGCTVNAPATYDIILPSAPVSFTHTLSDYGGYNISCKGNDNGLVQITATGGNGGNYTGYKYALDNNPYADASLIEHIKAGTHTLYVKDGRGCIVSQQINMTEPAAVLGLTVTGKEHNGCGADTIGTLTVAPQGGAAPFRYAIDDKPWQDNPVFTNLIAGDYKLQVRDGTGCTTDITTTLTSRYPSLSATADITNVNCYGESNGALKLHIAGGDGVYSYQWNSTLISGDGAENIIAGDYAVTVTDSKGCKQALTYTVSQPAILALTVTAPPVCDGLSDGTLDALVTGGTAPYQYALDQGNWLPTGTFGDLAPGSYHVAVKDAHNCAVDQDLTISKANTKPEINFLVASRRNAFDTLVIKEINIPAPDRVSWSYDPAALLLGTENGTPLIKFTNPGTYWVEMSATFGECTYSLRKELEIGNYDPNAGPPHYVPVQVIDTVTLSPNPNNGYFNYKIKLNRKQQIVVYVYDMNGVMAGKKQYTPTLTVDDNFQVGGTATGTFILRVITESESKDVRFIISR